MVRVLHFGLSANRGGIEIALLRLAQEFVCKPIELAFVGPNDDSAAISTDLDELGYRIFPVRSRTASFTGSRRDWAELFDEYEPDILHFHANTLSYIYPVTLALRRNIKVIIHSRSSSSPDRMLTRLLHRLHYTALQSQHITRAAVSRSAGQWLHGDQEFTVIFNGIDVDRFAYNPEARSRLRQELGVQDDLVIGQIGSFLPVKNHRFSLEVFAHLVQVAPRTRLVFVGSGVTQAGIEEEAERLGLRERITFLGTRTDVPDLLSSFDAFLMPSYYEGFPNAALEAQTAGLPAFLSNSVTREVRVTPLCTYLPLEVGAAKWASAILGAVRGDVEREKAGSWVKEAGFTSEAEARRIENLYMRVMGL